MKLEKNIEDACFTGLDNWIGDLVSNSNGNPSSAMADYDGNKGEFISKIQNIVKNSTNFEDFSYECESSNLLGYHIIESLNVDETGKLPWRKTQSYLSNGLNSLAQYEYNWEK